MGASEIKKLLINELAKDNIRYVLDELKKIDILNKEDKVILTQLTGRYNSNENDYILGLIKQEEYTIQKNQIRYSVLTLVSSFNEKTLSNNNSISKENSRITVTNDELRILSKSYNDMHNEWLMPIYRSSGNKKFKLTEVKDKVFKKQILLKETAKLLMDYKDRVSSYFLFKYDYKYPFDQLINFHLPPPVESIQTYYEEISRFAELSEIEIFSLTLHICLEHRNTMRLNSLVLERIEEMQVFYQENSISYRLGFKEIYW